MKINILLFLFFSVLQFQSFGQKEKYQYFNEAYASDDQDFKIRNYSVVIALDEYDFAAYNLRGYAYYNVAKYDLAIKDHNRALILHPEYDYAYFYRALSYIKQGKIDLAIVDLRHAIKIDPNYSKYHGLLSSLNEVAIQDEYSIKKRLKTITESLDEKNVVSESIKTEVKTSVKEDINIDGEKELNLHIEYQYEVIKANIERKTDDFPPGGYKLTTSNAAKLTAKLLKETIENELVKYFTVDTKITIKITGTTDGTPINSPIPYSGEYGNFKEEMYMLNGNLETISISTQKGISSNAQLAFLRTQGIRKFIEIYIDPLKQTKNTFQHYGIVKEEKGAQHRKIAIEIIIHDAFNFQKRVASSYNDMNAQQMSSVKGKRSEIDINLPLSKDTQERTYALVIGNEDYQSRQKSLSIEQNVPYATNDAQIFGDFCIKTLGIPSRQVKVLKNATSAEMQKAVSWISQLAELENGKAKLIFYYSGHGLPDEQTKAAFLIPVDVSGRDLTLAIKLKDIYKQLAMYPSEQVTIFLDACFSGGARNQSLVQNKGIKIKANGGMITGNMIVFASSSGLESSAVYNEEQHGLYTYFLLKKLKETKGNVKLRALSEYLNKAVGKEALLQGIKQTPQVNYSLESKDSWGEWGLK